MHHKLKFFLSLIVILLFSWADVFFAGTNRINALPEIWRQSIHVIALLLTMFIGYANWKNYPEKWLADTWLAIYAIMIVALISGAGFYLLKLPYSLSYLRGVIYLRNRFTWPLIFLIWYMLHLMSTYLVKVKKQ